MRYTLIHLPVTDSTNSYLLRRIAGKDKPGELFVRADYQESGKGRGEHTWFSSPGKNLLFSWLAFPAFLSASEQFRMSKAVALALAGVLDKYIEGVKLKWPNDLIAGNRKIGGILIESSLTADRINYMVSGIGLNINEDSFPEFPFPATSLYLETGRVFDLAGIFRLITEGLYSWYDLLQSEEGEKVDEQYLQRLYRINEESLFETKEEQFRARLTGVDAYGQAVIEMADGKTEIYAYGDLHQRYEG